MSVEHSRRSGAANPGRLNRDRSCPPFCTVGAPLVAPAPPQSEATEWWSGGLDRWVMTTLTHVNLCGIGNLVG
eukprot:362220-Chlamydomonas_euryale.AAC.5